MRRLAIPQPRQRPNQLLNSRTIRRSRPATPAPRLAKPPVRARVLAEVFKTGRALAVREVRAADPAANKAARDVPVDTVETAGVPAGIAGVPAADLAAGAVAGDAAVAMIGVEEAAVAAHEICRRRNMRLRVRPIKDRQSGARPSIGNLRHARMIRRPPITCR